MSIDNLNSEPTRNSFATMSPESLRTMIETLEVKGKPMKGGDFVRAILEESGPAGVEKIAQKIERKDNYFQCSDFDATERAIFKKVNLMSRRNFIATGTLGLASLGFFNGTRSHWADMASAPQSRTPAQAVDESSLAHHLIGEPAVTQKEHEKAAIINGIGGVVSATFSIGSVGEARLRNAIEAINALIARQEEKAL